MANDYVMEKNKIGSVILYLRESYQISQSKLGKGLCSVATLSRIEAGERDADPLLLEALLERLGKTPNQFELVLTDLDYVLLQSREEIRTRIEEKKIDEANTLLDEYERATALKGSVHMQFIIASRALLNELKGGAVEDTMSLLLEAITCTVPDFKTNKIRDNYLSNSELNIVIELVQRMISSGAAERAKEILLQVIDFLDQMNSIENNDKYYSRVAVMASRLFLQENHLEQALDMCSKGLEKHKGCRSMNYLSDLYLIKAQTTEALLKVSGQWKPSDRGCLKPYLLAYHLYNVCEEYDPAEKIKKHLREEYLWEDIV